MACHKLSLIKQTTLHLMPVLSSRLIFSSLDVFYIFLQINCVHLVIFFHPVIFFRRVELLFLCLLSKYLVLFDNHSRHLLAH